MAFVAHLGTCPTFFAKFKGKMFLQNFKILFSSFSFFFSKSLIGKSKKNNKSIKFPKQPSHVKYYDFHLIVAISMIHWKDDRQMIDHNNSSLGAFKPGELTNIYINIYI